MNRNNKILILVLVGVGLIALAVFIAIFINGNETRTSEPVEGEHVSAVYCTAKGIEGAFFSSEIVNTITNEVKITYHDSGIEKLYYSYKGTYRSNDVLKQDDGVFQAKYNNYMSEHGQNSVDLSPVYDEMNNKLHIALYADSLDKINEATSVFFFINGNEVNQFKKYTMDDMKKYYEDKSFSCKIVK